MAKAISAPFKGGEISQFGWNMETQSRIMRTCLPRRILRMQSRWDVTS